MRVTILAIILLPIYQKSLPYGLLPDDFRPNRQ